ncbi:MAG TPA: hypothetical protein ENK74_08125 [Nitratifractor sp.]|jgi:hypothetical protein|nr:hypothetical protein [Nitratifractor sp.]
MVKIFLLILALHLMPSCSVVDGENSRVSTPIGDAQVRRDTVSQSSEYDKQLEEGVSLKSNNKKRGKRKSSTQKREERALEVARVCFDKSGKAHNCNYKIAKPYKMQIQALQ